MRCSKDRFGFTPIKSSKPIPRLWDRIPSAPLSTRAPAQRQLWKRVQPSLDRMKALHQRSNTIIDATEDLNTEINGTRDKGYLRPVKRRRLGLSDCLGQEAGLFAETKLELEISMKKRKLPTVIEAALSYDDPSMPRGSHTEKETTESAVFQDLLQAQESRLARPITRSSLDNEDTAVLSSFLSKAQAKRAARAIAAQRAQEKAEQMISELCPQTSPRRALNSLDTNSPSSMKARFSPQKTDSTDSHASSLQLEDKSETEGSPLPTSAINRRSTRARQPPIVRNIILRRAKGTEFIFRPRTEEREVEMKTRENTVRNRGDSMFPKDVLQAMAKQPGHEQPVSNGCAGSERSHKNGEKHISWRKLRFIEYDTGLYDNYLSDSSDNEKTAVEHTRKSRSARRDSKTSSHRPCSDSASTDKRRAGNANEKVAAGSSDVGSTAPADAKKTRRIRRLGPRTSEIPAVSSSDNLKGLEAPLPRDALLTSPTSNGGGQLTAHMDKVLVKHAGSTPKPRRVRPKS